MNTFEILKQAKEGKYAIGAFNAANIETLKAITNVAQKYNTPVIVEASEGEISYIGLKQFVALIKTYREESGIPIILNLDHAKTFEDCKNAIDAGFEYVHIDGSNFSYDENIKLSKKVVEYAHERNVVVEGEMDHIKGSSADHSDTNPNELSKKEYMTDPKAAKEFVEQTGIDVFASFIGNLHGVYSEETRLNFEIFEELTKLLPDTYFSLHGGSGINSEDVKKAIGMGIVKVNVNSELRIAFKINLKKALDKTDKIAIYKITPSAIEAVERVVEEKIQLFGNRDQVQVNSII